MIAPNPPENPIGHDAAESTARQADELFIHGLLGVLHDTNRKQRVDAAIAALPDLRAPRARGRHLRRLVTICSAALLLLAGVAWLQVSSGTTAYATITQSIEAVRSKGSHRYEVRLAHFPEDELPENPIGTVDNSAPNQMLLDFTAPNGRRVVVGRDSEGEWAILRNGNVERENARQFWPRWAEVGNESIFADSIDQLMESLLPDYNFKKLERGPLPGGEGSFDRVVGERRPDSRGPSPEHIDLWINPKTKQLERLELRWPELADCIGPPDGPLFLPDGPMDRPEGDRRFRDGPPGPHGPPNGPLNGGPPPRFGPGPEGRKPPGDRMDDGPPDHPRRGPDDGPRDRPEGRPMGGPDGGPEGQLRGGPNDGPRNGPRHDARPRRPLSRVVVTRVECPDLDAAWFSPSQHQKP